MNNARPFLVQALILSLILHAAAIFVNLPASAPKQKAAPMELKARLAAPRPADPIVPMVPLTAPLEQPRLMLPPEPPRNANAVAAVSKKPAAPSATSVPQPLSGDAAQKAMEQLARELPYPQEAIERDQQGEAVVLLFLDRAGNVVAARLEASSGYALLDEAALRAARQLRALPDSAPREALLPVRFRLK